MRRPSAGDGDDENGESATPLSPSLPLSLSLPVLCFSVAAPHRPTGQTAAKPDTQTFATFKDDDVGD